MSLSRAVVIKEGDRVEVISLGTGFEHSYFAARVISPVQHIRYRVRYEKLMNEDNENEPLEEEVSMAKVRPYPEAIQQWNYFCCEIVDGYINDGWWLGRIVHRDGERYIIGYEDRTFYSHAFEDIRLHQEWYQGAWMYAKLTVDY